MKRHYTFVIYKHDVARASHLRAFDPVTSILVMSANVSPLRITSHRPLSMPQTVNDYTTTGGWTIATRKEYFNHLLPRIT